MPGQVGLCLERRMLNPGRITAIQKTPSSTLLRSQSVCLSPSMLCCGVLTLILSWASLAADTAAAVVSRGGFGWVI